MYHSIQHFIENGIPQLQEIQKKFMKDPACLGEYVEQVGQVVQELGRQILCETIEGYNDMLEDSTRRRVNWVIKDRGEKSLLTTLGPIHFTHTRFQHKTTKETAYLLDRAMGLEPHVRLSPDAKARLLEGAAQGSYQKAGELSGGLGSVTRQTVMRHVHGIQVPSYKKEQSAEKRRVKYLYVEADEDHIALQFHEKKGDIKRWKGHGDNGKIVKLVYVHEGYEDAGAKRKKLKEVRYFGGLYTGKENETLWREVKEYIKGTYEVDEIEKIYFQSDGGSWMKKGLEMLGGTFVLDEFHLRKYVRRMARAAGEEEKEEEILKQVEKGEGKKLREWAEERKKELGEKEGNRLEESLGYLEKNWKGIRTRVKKGEGVIGSSTEGHISHVLSARMSSRPMGWSEKGASKLSRLRIYWKNGEKIEELWKECGKEEKWEGEEGKCLSAEELIRWEKRSGKRNGKYVEAIQAGIRNQTKMKLYFQESVGKILG